MGDFNAKVGENHHDTLPDVVGDYGLGECNDRGWNLLQFCALKQTFCGKYGNAETQTFEIKKSSTSI